MIVRIHYILEGTAIQPEFSKNLRIQNIFLYICFYGMQINAKIIDFTLDFTKMQRSN